MRVEEIQSRLAALGYVVGPIDGIPGRRTLAAIRAFQRDRGLEVDGIVGPQTLKALTGKAPKPTPSGGKLTPGSLHDGTLPWLQEARRLVGTREAPGAANNPVILDWADNLDLHYKRDEDAWCGLFVAHCIGATLVDESLPSNPLGARQLLRFGVPCTPTVGSILVFWREKPEGWKGHVGFYAGESAKAFCVLGGNQGNAVSLAWIAKDRLLGARWPSGVAVRTGVLKVPQGSNPLSGNEA
jgi:uncharacterized protein (TIGR02594 family)